MDSVRILFVAVAGVCASGCTQVHQLGQVGEGAETAGSATSSIASDDSGDSSDSSSSGMSTDDTTDSGSETSDTTGDTGDETDGTETGETDDPIPDACDVVDLGGTEGLTVDIVLMTQWDAGACHEFYVTNETGEDLVWTEDLRFGGTLDNYWNADGEELNSTDWRFAGAASANNVVVLAGKTIVFGGCMACTPP